MAPTRPNIGLATCVASPSATPSTPAVVVAYRQRWQIELFFRWLKHGLSIQAFYCTGNNAVRLQPCASICVYLAMATARRQLGITTNPTTFAQVLA